MLQSVKDAIRHAKVIGLESMFEDGNYAKRSLVALAKGIGETEEVTAELLAQAFPTAVRTIGQSSGKVFYSFR